MMNSFRNLLFQIHLWMGLTLGLLFIVLGLTGSVLVYPQLFMAGRDAPPAATAQGERLPLEQIIAAARQSAPQSANASATLALPRDGAAASVRFSAQGGRGFGRGAGRGTGFGRGEGIARDGAGRGEGFARGGAGRGEAFGGRGRGGFAGRGGRGGAAGPEIFVDPVSGTVLGTRVMQSSPVTGIAHQLHENLMLRRGGRSLVGWLGVGMLFLGLSGLYLWWPKSGQWKYAFIVRPGARGARLYREIHGAFGIWFLIVFLVVTATGIPLSFPGLMGGRGGPPAGGPPPDFAPPGFAAPQTIAVPEDGERQPLNALVAAAERAAGGRALSLTVPSQADRPVTVTIRMAAGPPTTVNVNPYTAEAAARTRPAGPPRGRGLSMRTLHAGDGLGPVWKALVFASGFLPLLFVVTGFLMWWKKRQARQERMADRPA